MCSENRSFKKEIYEYAKSFIEDFDKSAENGEMPYRFAPFLENLRAEKGLGGILDVIEILEDRRYILGQTGCAPSILDYAPNSPSEAPSSEEWTEWLEWLDRLDEVYDYSGLLDLAELDGLFDLNLILDLDNLADVVDIDEVMD